MKKLITILLLFVSLVSFSQESHLLVGTVVSPPFVIKGDGGNFEGISFNLWNNISRNLNIEYTVKEYNCIEDLLKGLESKEIDLTVYSLSMNTERLNDFNFSQPYYITHSSILSKKSNTSWYSFIFAVFNSRFITLLVWLFIILFILGAIIWRVEHKENDLITSDRSGVFNCLYFIVISITTMGYGDITPKTNAGKSFVMILGLVSMCVSGLFVGSISSKLTLDNINEHQIESIQELKQTKTASIDDTFSSNYLNRNDIKHLQYSDLNTCFEDLQKGELECIFYDTEQLKYTIKENKITGYKLSNKTFSTQMYGLCARKTLDFNRINVEIMKVTNSNDWIKYVENILN